MDELEIIRTAHRIDHGLGLLAVAVTDDGLREQILVVQEGWRPLAYGIAAAVCGVEPSMSAGGPRKRGRPKKEGLADRSESATPAAENAENE